MRLRAALLVFGLIWVLWGREAGYWLYTQEYKTESECESVRAKLAAKSRLESLLTRFMCTQQDRPNLMGNDGIQFIPPGGDARRNRNLLDRLEDVKPRGPELPRAPVD
jgi:hypothetical protein